MKRDPIDFHSIEDGHIEIHTRLLNWSRWVRPGRSHWVSPTWRQGKSNGRQWHLPVVRESVDTLDAHRIEKAVAALPAKHRDALRWAYVWGTSSPLVARMNGWPYWPDQAARSLAMSLSGLKRTMREGRIMLINRL